MSLKARICGVSSIPEMIENYPGLSKKQREDVKDKFDEFVKDKSREAIAQTYKKFDKEFSAMTLMVLHNELGFGPIRLARFAKQFKETWDAVADQLAGTDILVNEGAYHDLKEVYPQCDEWIGVEEDEDICSEGLESK